MVFGLALKDLADQIRSFVEKEVQKDYVNLKTSHIWLPAFILRAYLVD